jgi:hypothetical protein
MATALVVAPTVGRAEEAYKKFRFSLTVNNYSSSDGLRTNADNTSFYRNEFGGLSPVDDPRPDSASKNEAQVDDGLRYDLQASYGIARFKRARATNPWAEITVDASLGYFEGDLGDLEVAGQYSTVDPPRTQIGERTRYHLTFIPMGEITQMPVEVGATLRFRPAKPLSPFISAGVGYIFAEVDPSDDFLEFSRNTAKSRGSYTFATGEGSSDSKPDHQLEAAQIVAPDTFEYHLAAGMEWTVAKGLSLTLRGAWMWAPESIDITIDGKHNFGEPTPNGEGIQYPIGGMPVEIAQGDGGLIDFGSGQAYDDPNTGQHFVGPPDGEPDAGSYYAQGGTLKYNGFSFGIGIRYQF